MHISHTGGDLLQLLGRSQTNHSLAASALNLIFRLRQLALEPMKQIAISFDRLSLYLPEGFFGGYPITAYHHQGIRQSHPQRILSLQ